MGSLQKLRRKNIQILPRALDKTSVLATFGSIGHSHTRFSANELWVALRIPWSLMYQLAASLMQANEFKKRIALSAEFCSRAYFHWHLRNWVTEWMRHALRNSILMIKRDAWRKSKSNSNTNSAAFFEASSSRISRGSTVATKTITTVSHHQQWTLVGR